MATKRIPFVLALGFWLGLSSAGLLAGDRPQVAAPPDRSDPVMGREIYVNTCIHCHGIDGTGAKVSLMPPPADLTSDRIQQRLDGALFKRIHDGKSNTAMGAWKYALSDDEIWDVLAYVRTLRRESSGPH